MAQPVMDTPQVADALQRSGMEREQAAGLARTLGTELGDHVAVNKDLDPEFERPRAHVGVLGTGVALVLAFPGVIASPDGLA